MKTDRFGWILGVGVLLLGRMSYAGPVPVASEVLTRVSVTTDVVSLLEDAAPEAARAALIARFPETGAALWVGGLNLLHDAIHKSHTIASVRALSEWVGAHPMPGNVMAEALTEMVNGNKAITIENLQATRSVALLANAGQQQQARANELLVPAPRAGLTGANALTPAAAKAYLRRWESGDDTEDAYMRQISLCTTGPCEEASEAFGRFAYAVDHSCDTATNEPNCVADQKESARDWFIGTYSGWLAGERTKDGVPKWKDGLVFQTELFATSLGFEHPALLRAGAREINHTARFTKGGAKVFYSKPERRVLAGCEAGCKGDSGACELQQVRLQ